MREDLIDKAVEEEKRGKAKWGAIDRTPDILLSALTEELGEVAHAINHNEGKDKIQQEIAEVMGLLSRLYDMVEDTSQIQCSEKEEEGQC